MNLTGEVIKEIWLMVWILFPCISQNTVCSLSTVLCPTSSWRVHTLQSQKTAFESKKTYIWNIREKMCWLTCDGSWAWKSIQGTVLEQKAHGIITTSSRGVAAVKIFSWLLLSLISLSSQVSSGGCSVNCGTSYTSLAVILINSHMQFVSVFQPLNAPYVAAEICWHEPFPFMYN